MKRQAMLLLLAAILLTAGCAADKVQPAATVPVTTGAEQLAAQLHEQGDGNSARVLQTSAAVGSQPLIELAAGGQGQIEYFIEQEATAAVWLRTQAEFLSTQGSGRIQISALDHAGRELATAGYVFTGEIPTSAGGNRWLDRRYQANYQGQWETIAVNPADFLREHVPAYDAGQVARYRMSVVTGQGQHAMIKELAAGRQADKLLSLTPAQAVYHAAVGDQLTISVQAVNRTSAPLAPMTVSLLEPTGFGVAIVGSAVQQTERLEPGAACSLSWQVKVTRPDAVNLQRPWALNANVEGSALPVAQIAAADPQAGKVFYVMTEDLEPMDSAGYATAWGNGNSWLDPEEFRVQLIQKAEALNRIAEKHGAKWTHYMAWPAVKAAEWAATQSQTGQWPQVIADIKQSVQQESRRGHEYAVHMHSDYDPLLPGNLLSYQPAVDGVWANHLRHGWSHSVAAEGSFNDSASRTGLLYTYQRIMDELSADSPQGQIVTTRAGSFDFGNGRESEATSTAAYRHVGLWGTSDADGNIGGSTSGNYGQEIYFASADDINHPAKTLEESALVEFRPTPRPSIGYDSQSAASMNQKADQGMNVFTQGGAIKPGIHAITGFTHAMFVMGSGDWRSVEGGQFAALDEHLAYLQERYASRGLLTFGTASELVKAYLDYYTPELLAVYGAKKASGLISTEYAIELLGQGISADAQHVRQVKIKYPLYLHDSAFYIRILKNGQPIYSTWGLPTPYNDIIFPVDDREAVYTMQVYHHTAAARVLPWLGKIKSGLKFIKNSQ